MTRVKLAATALLGIFVMLPGQTAARTPAAVSCRPRTAFVAHGYGAPDDVVMKGRTILFSDTTAGVVGAIKGKHRRVLVGHLNVPEGIVVRSHNRLVVVEQGANRLDTIDVRHGRRAVLLQLRNTTGLEGVDAITPIGADLLIPNSPYGQLLRLHHGQLRVITNDLRRPVDAIPYQGGIAVADENANAVWLVRNGTVRRLATVSIPDDLAVFHGRLLAVTLGDGVLWEIRPHLKRLVGGFGQPQGLAVESPKSLVIADSRRNALYRVVMPVACLS
jgi:hypothetical protein